MDTFRDRRKCLARSPHRGVTLVDLMLGLSIFSILTAFAIPRFNELTASFNRMNARSNLTQDLKRAQSETITQGCRGVVRIATNSRSYTFGCDYLTYDTNPSPSPDRVSFVRNLPDGVAISSGSPIIFNSRGQAVDADNVINNNVITLWEVSSGGTDVFASGQLLGTGVFSYD